jgi:hypothetical protein
MKHHSVREGDAFGSTGAQGFIKLRRTYPEEHQPRDRPIPTFQRSWLDLGERYLTTQTRLGLEFHWFTFVIKSLTLVGSGVCGILPHHLPFSGPVSHRPFQSKRPDDLFTSGIGSNPTSAGASGQAI